ncbi:hypothetical protein BMETH_684_0 [methanotrophic bacterial endosymbiont of Bathymodiolus sp.]|nr:hypothetical protein BMETH_684_0 [methanotrophic bacterial endosymbiont of Bathymodiolus sp.]
MADAASRPLLVALQLCLNVSSPNTEHATAMPVLLPFELSP